MNRRRLPPEETIESFCNVSDEYFVPDFLRTPSQAMTQTATLQNLAIDMLRLGILPTGASGDQIVTDLLEHRQLWTKVVAANSDHAAGQWLPLLHMSSGEKEAWPIDRLFIQAADDEPGLLALVQRWEPDSCQWIALNPGLVLQLAWLEPVPPFAEFLESDTNPRWPVEVSVLPKQDLMAAGCVELASSFDRLFGLCPSWATFFPDRKALAALRDGRLPETRAERIVGESATLIKLSGKPRPTREEALQYSRDVLDGDGDSRAVVFRMPPSITRSPAEAMTIIRRYVSPTLADISVA